MKDWTGNGNSIYKTIGASNHTEEAREQNDYYATHPKAVRVLLDNEEFNKQVWEPACGGGHMSDILKEYGYEVRSTDLIDRGYSDAEICDFLSATEPFVGDIITNPPYKYAKEFVEKALELTTDGSKIAMFFKLTFLEGQSRKELFTTNPPKVVYVSSSRLGCAKNGEFKIGKYGEPVIESAVAYAWFVWEKGFKGDTIIKWVN
jgi:hypothetical protein